MTVFNSTLTAAMAAFAGNLPRSTAHGLAPVITVSDTFARANGAPGANWALNGTGTIDINTNALESSTGTASTPEVAAWNAATFSNDQFSQATLVQRDTHTNAQVWGPGVRLSLTAATGYICGELVGNGSIRVYKLVAGALTVLATPGGTLAVNDVIRLEVSDVSGNPTLVVRKNGAIVTTIADLSSPILSGAVGMGAWGGIAGGNTYNTWSGGTTVASMSPWVGSVKKFTSKNVHAAAMAAWAGAVATAKIKLQTLAAAMAAFAGLLPRQTNRALAAATAAFAGAQSRATTSNQTAATAAFAGAMARFILRGISGAMASFTGSVGKVTARSVTASMAAWAGAIAKTQFKLQALVAAMAAFAGIQTRSTSKNQTAATAPFSGSISKLTSRAMAAAMSAWAALVAGVRRIVTGSAMELQAASVRPALEAQSALARVAIEAQSAQPRVALETMGAACRIAMEATTAQARFAMEALGAACRVAIEATSARVIS